MKGDLTQGHVMKTMLRFAVPMILGNLLQQCYNVADTLIVGRFLGADALAAVGSAFTLMTFLTSILLGLCMGSGAVFSIRFGQRDTEKLKEGMCTSFFLIAGITLVLNVLAFIGLEWLLAFLQVPQQIQGLMRSYLVVIFCGIFATFLYNYFASLLRAVGNSAVPLAFLAVSALLNIGLDLWFVLGLGRGVAGAAEATVIAQTISGVGIAAYTGLKYPQLRIHKRHLRIRWACVREIAGFSVLTCAQQSIMNLGILMVQGQQLWRHSDGGFCRCGKNRFLCLYACARFWQCVFYLYCTKLWRTETRPHPGRAERGHMDSDGVLPFNFGRGLGLGPPADAAVCGGRGNSHLVRRHSLFAYRRGFLLRHWLPVFALWVIPCGGAARHVGGTYCHFAGYEGSVGVYAICVTKRWRSRDLVVGANRMVFGGHGRPCLLLEMQKTAIALFLDRKYGKMMQKVYGPLVEA